MAHHETLHGPAPNSQQAIYRIEVDCVYVKTVAFCSFTSSSVLTNNSGHQLPPVYLIKPPPQKKNPSK